LTVSGVVKSVSVDGNTAFVDVASSSPCMIDTIDIAKSRLPRSCIEGARFSASGKVEDVFEIFLNATTISCR
jgi:hypothetical protein